METKQTIKPQHNVTMENRSKTIITGVQEVLSATQGGVYIKLYDGQMEISGENLKVEKLSPEEKLLIISGLVNSIKYNTLSSKNFFKKLFK